MTPPCTTVCWGHLSEPVALCSPTTAVSTRSCAGRKGMTLMLLWEEHSTRHPGQSTHRYSQFCENYRGYCKSLKRSMRQIHRAGEKLFIDYAGPTLGLIDGSRTHIFVAALGASSYTYACATPRETMADWLGATALALRSFGGVPQSSCPTTPKP
jgi:transposase